MLICKRIDLTGYPNKPKAIIYYVSVTSQNAKMVKDSIPADQIRHVEAGDEMSVYAIDGSASNSPRRLTIWYNKEVAAIETAEGSIWGDWDEDKLLLTEEFEEAQDVDGSSIGGRIVYNLFGLRGIYSSGNFYLFTDSTSDT